MSDNKSYNDKRTKRIYSRREFLKMGAGATALGLTALGAKSALAGNTPFFAPNISRQTAKTIKLMTWFWNEPGRQDAWRQMVELFHAAQSDVRIEEAGWPFDQYTDNILIQVQSGMIDADLFTNTPDLAIRMLAASQMEPIESVADAAGINKDLSKAHDFLRKDDHLYGLDCVTVKFGLLYNQALFEKDGVAVPTTIDEWTAAAAALTHRPDQFGIYSPHVSSAPEATWFTLQQWALPYDGRWADGKKPLVNSEPIINGMKLFKTMYDSSFPQGTDEATAIRMYGNGQIAMDLIVSAAVNAFKASGESSGGNVYQSLRSAVPPWESKRVITRIHPIAVNANAADDNKAAAKTFLTWLYTPENYQQLLEKALDVIPAFPQGIRKEYLDSLPWLEGYQAGVDITPPEVMGDFILYNSEFGKIVVNHLQEVLTANRPVEEAMGDAQTELEALGERVFA
ncbi:MAG: extracellular solute-binding protein [Anaerolineae bacterium]|nr:extracellular solute-binding protein [Anaerolineae bacterium]